MAPEIEYKSLYRGLAWKLSNLGCRIWDYDYYGFCSFIGKRDKALIHIHPRLTYKEKLFTLAHEAGHLFTLERGKNFKWSKKNRTEKQANWFAIQFLNHFKIDVTEYYVFYERAKKRNKRNRQPWHKL